MEPMPDIDERVNEIAASAAREYFAAQRAKPGATGRSPDGAVEVTVNGLGDVTDVRVHARDVPPDVAARLAAAMKAAWTAAARAHAVAETDNPLARQAGLAELVEEQINERFGPPPRQARPPHEARRSSVRNEDEDFSESSFMHSALPSRGAT